MELLVAFAIGWVVGAHGGEEGFRDVVQAATELRRSEEFAALMEALRAHLAYTLRSLADVLSAPESEISPESVVERVVQLMRGRGSASSAS